MFFRTFTLLLLLFNFLFTGLFAQSSFGDIVISEIMSDPSPVVGLPEYEYIELYNRTDDTITLKSWSISTGNSIMLLDQAFIAPKAYLILSNQKAKFEFEKYGNFYGFTSFSINNENADIVLYNNSGRIISAIDFNIELFRDSYKKEGGWAIERIDPDNKANDANNWAASKDFKGGTPGSKNSVFAANADRTSPFLYRIAYIDNKTIKLNFSEGIDSTSLINTDYYYCDNDLGLPANIKLCPPYYDKVILEFKNLIKPGIIYNLVISDSLKDWAGNYVDNLSAVSFAVPDTIKKNDIIINEILSNPFSDGVDFVEIYNLSKRVLDLKYLLLCNFDSITGRLVSPAPVSDESYLIFPATYYVLTTRPDKIKKQYRTKNPNSFIKMKSFPQYNNDEGIVVIANRNEYIIDIMEYNAAMHYPLLSSRKGVSLERINFNISSLDKNNWHSAAESAGYATPAYRNSQAVELYDKGNELNIYPEIFSPDNDGKDDVLSISYRFLESDYTGMLTIFDAQGRRVRLLLNNVTLGTEGIFFWNGMDDNYQKVPAGIYIIYMEIFNLKGSKKQFKKTAIIAYK